jgi:DNA-binding CsgD family transcriptional regulator
VEARDALLIGQADLLAQLRSVLEAVERGPAGGVVEGSPGVGKTTLWSTALAGVSPHWVVLLARAVESETTLEATGIADLLGPVAGRVLPALPPPQRAAVEAALLIARPAAPPDSRALGAALLSILRLLAAESPVIVAVDDLQWMDAMSGSALAFAARRLVDERVGVLMTRRDDLPSVPLALPNMVVVRPRPLEADDVGELLRRRGWSLPPVAVRRIHEFTDGNPFYALQVAATLAGRGAELLPDEPLPFPRSLARVIEQRLGTLPDTERDGLLAAALLGAPTLSVVSAATGNSLVRSEEDGIVALDDDRIAFTHPLLAAAVRERATSEERRLMHRRLADAVDGVEQRAHHLAHATVAPDEAVADAIWAAAQQARLRGAASAAAAFADHAVRLTPRSNSQLFAGRLAGAGELWFAVGDHQRAVPLLEEAVATLTPGPGRAGALLTLADGVKHDVSRALPILDRAFAESGDDLLMRSRVLGMRATLRGVVLLDDVEAAQKEAQAALRLAEEAGVPELIVSNLVTLLWLALIHGDSLDELFERAQQFDCPTLPAYWQPERPTFVWRIRSGVGRSVRGPLLEMRRQMEDSGQEENVSVMDYHLADLAIFAGEWDEAQRHAAALTAFAAAVPPSRPVAASIVGLLDALRGDLEEATRVVEAGLRDAAAHDAALFATQLAYVLALIGVSRRQWAQVVESCGDVLERSLRCGLRNVGFLQFWPDLVEAHVHLGATAEAEELTRRLEAEARRQRNAWGLITAGRSRGIVATAHGDLAQAEEAFARALGMPEIEGLPFERARTHLARGSALLRSRRRADARAALETALSGFEALGAPVFAEWTRDELARIAGRRPTQDLTSAQQRVAQLAAAGKQNKEIASQLLISEHTVDSHLRQVYAKLGVKNRTELARRLAH